MTLPQEHKLIFEFALIVHNRSALGYCNAWEYHVSDPPGDTEDKIIAFTMRGPHTRGPHFGPSKHQALQKHQRVREANRVSSNDTYFPPLYDPSKFPTREYGHRDTGDRTDDSFIPEYLWGLPIRALDILFEYNDYMNTYGNQAVNYTSPSVSGQREFNDLRYTDGVDFFLATKHEAVPSADNTLPVELLMKRYADSLSTKRHCFYDWKHYEEDLRSGIRKL